MEDARIPTHLWVSAKIRQCNQDLIPAYVRHKGELQGGALILKLDLFDKGSKVLTQARDLDGRLGWMNAFKEGLVSNEKAEDYIARAIQRDPDVWVVEIEHADGWHPFEGPEIGL
jgi:hypothetical protein